MVRLCANCEVSEIKKISKRKQVLWCYVYDAIVGANNVCEQWVYYGGNYAHQRIQKKNEQRNCSKNLKLNSQI